MEWEKNNLIFNKDILRLRLIYVKQRKKNQNLKNKSFNYTNRRFLIGVKALEICSNKRNYLWSKTKGIWINVTTQFINLLSQHINNKDFNETFSVAPQVKSSKISLIC